MESYVDTSQEGFNTLESRVSRRAARLDALQPASHIPKPCFASCIRGTNHWQTHVALREYTGTAVQSLISFVGGHLSGSQERIYSTEGRVQAFLDANDSLLNNINKSGKGSECFSKGTSDAKTGVGDKTLVEGHMSSNSV